MKSNPNHIFIDTNVLIGAWKKKKKDIECISYLTSLKGKKLYVSALSIAQLVSVFQKTKTNEQIKAIIQTLLHQFTVLSFTESDVRSIMQETAADLEDCIQYVISKKMKCAVFVTNNIKDYRTFADIQAIAPAKIRVIPK